MLGFFGFVSDRDHGERVDEGVAAGYVYVGGIRSLASKRRTVIR